MKDLSDYLLPIERKFLLRKGYDLQKDIFQRDICSYEPNKSSYYNNAVCMMARLLGYRDHWDRDFQKARQVYNMLSSM